MSWYFDFSCHHFNLIPMISQSIFFLMWLKWASIHLKLRRRHAWGYSWRNILETIWDTVYWYAETESLSHCCLMLMVVSLCFITKAAHAVIGLLVRRSEQQIKVMFTSAFLQRSFFRAWDQIILSLNTHIYYTERLSFFHLCKNTLSASRTWQSHGVSL